MENRTFDVTVLEELTGGYFTPQVAHNWLTRGLWYSDIEAPGRGRARRFTRINAIEAVIAVELLRGRLTREHSHQAFKRRIQEFRDGPTGYEDEIPNHFPELPEFKPGSVGWRWAIFTNVNIHSHKDSGHVVACKGFSQEDAAALFRLHDDDTFLILPISHVVRRVDALLDAVPVDSVEDR